MHALTESLFFAIMPTFILLSNTPMYIADKFRDLVSYLSGSKFKNSYREGTITIHKEVKRTENE